MATKADKKNAIRQEIIDSAAIYSQSLAGKAFIYIYMGKINLYFSIVKYDDMPIEMKYLNIVQALGTYHARFKYNDLKKYKKHVLQLFRCKTIDKIDEKQRNAYFDVTQSDENITYIILKSRLVDLMNDDFRTPITPVYTNGKIIELLVYTEVL